MKAVTKALAVVVIAVNLAQMVKSNLYMDCLSDHQCRPTTGQPYWRCCPEHFCCYVYQYQSRDTKSKCISNKESNRYSPPYCSTKTALTPGQLGDQRNFVLPKTSTLLTLVHLTGNPIYWKDRDRYGEEGLRPDILHQHNNYASGFFVNNRQELALSGAPYLEKTRPENRKKYAKELKDLGFEY